MEIWHEITQEKACGVRREEGLGQNSKELQQQRDRLLTTEAGGRGRAGRKPGEESRRSLGTQGRQRLGRMLLRPDKVRTEKGLLDLTKITGNCKKPQGGHG